MSWNSLSNITSKDFICGWCGNRIASANGYFNSGSAKIYICHFCQKPNYFDGTGGQYPGASYGTEIKNLPEDIETIYNEIRRLHGESAWTAIVLLARKLLMHVAVEKGAPEGKQFITYVQYLTDNYVAKSNQGWVDRVRTVSNIANHELKIMDAAQARMVTDFTGMILKLVYEFAPPEA